MSYYILVCYIILYCITLYYIRLHILYVYLYGAPLCTYLFCVLHFLYLFSGEIGGTFLGIGCLPFVLRACFTCAVGMVEHYLVLIRGPAGIGSNTGMDRRSKIEDAWKSFWDIFNLQSSIQAGIGSNTRVLDPIPGFSTSIPVQVKN